MKNGKIVGLEDFKEANSLKSRIAEYNKKYAVAMVGSSLRIVENVDDDIKLLRKNDFFDFNKHDTIQIEGKNGPVRAEVSKIWFADSSTARYREIVFEPGGTVARDTLNRFQGLPIEPKKGGWGLMQHHVLRVICGDDKELYKYLIQWLARIVQDPGGKRPGVAVVLRGGEGTGKGKLLEWYGKLFGKHYLPLNDSQMLTGRFNSILATKIVVFADEALFAGDKGAADRLKGLITEPHQVFEMKGVDAQLLSSHINIVMASNHDWVVPASADSRRYFMLDVKDHHRKDYNFFSRLDAEMDSGGLQAMMYDLMQVKVDVNFLREAPETAALSDQRLRAMDSVPSFWAHCLSRGHILEGSANTGFEEGVNLKRDDIHTLYLTFCQAHRLNYPLGLNSFFRKTYGTNGVFPDSKERMTKRTNTDRYFRPLLMKDMQEMFQKSTGVSIEW
jgi:hypothetical protein